MPLKYTVELTESQRLELARVVRIGEAPVRAVRRAYSLLWSAEGLSDATIAERLGCAAGTVAATRRRWCASGLAALWDRPRCGRPPRLTGRQEAQLVALACSPTPDGGRWTLCLLAEEMVSLGWVETLSPSTVRRVLKKTRSRPTGSASGV